MKYLLWRIWYWLTSWRRRSSSVRPGDVIITKGEDGLPVKHVVTKVKNTTVTLEDEQS